jgi:hypothetical protein
MAKSAYSANSKNKIAIDLPYECNQFSGQSRNITQSLLDGSIAKFFQRTARMG